MNVALRFDPGHQLVATKAAVAAHNDLRVLAEARANGGNDLLQGIERAVTAITIRGAQLRPERDVAAKAIERQVTVVAVVAVVEAPFLAAVNAVVGRVEIEHDDLALACDGLHALAQQQRFDLAGVRPDLARAAARLVGVLRAELQAVERALAGQRLAFVLREMTLEADHIGASAHRGPQRIEAQLVVIIDVFVSQRDGEDALAQHHGEIMLDEALIARIGEATGKFLAEPLRAIHLAQQQRAAITGEVATGEIRLDAPAAELVKIEALLVTPCRRLHRVHARCFTLDCPGVQAICSDQRAMGCEKCGLAGQPHYFAVTCGSFTFA